MKTAEDIYIRVMEVGDGCVVLGFEVPVGVPVRLEHTVVCLVPDPDGTLPSSSTPPGSPD